MMVHLVCLQGWTGAGHAPTVVVVIVLSLRAGALTPRGPILWWSSLCTSLCAGALTPCMMVRLVWLHGWIGAGQALCGVSASQRRDACIPGLWVVGRLRLSKPAKNDPWAGLQGRVGRSGRAPAQGCSCMQLHLVRRWGVAPPRRWGVAPLRPDCRGCHCAQPSCWCIDTLRSHHVVVVFVLVH